MSYMRLNLFSIQNIFNSKNFEREKSLLTNKKKSVNQIQTDLIITKKRNMIEMENIYP